MIKIGFVTCVELGFACMKALNEKGVLLSLAVTLEDTKAKKKSGRIYLDEFCGVHSIPLLKVKHINDKSVISLIKKKELDWLFIIGWSQIANMQVLSSPKKGVLGIHPTLLPQGRGRAAIPWAIIKELDETGVTLFKLDKGVDTGPIVGQKVVPLTNKITATELYKLVYQAHIELIKEIIPDILKDNVELISQDESKATVWDGRNPHDGEINICGSVKEAEILVRATTRPYPGAFFYDFDKRKVIVWRAKRTQTFSNCVIKFHDGYLKLLEFEVLD